MKKLKVLETFAGTRSISKKFEEREDMRHLQLNGIKVILI